MAKMRVAVLPVIGGETLPSTRTPRICPPRSTIGDDGVVAGAVRGRGALEQLIHLRRVKLLHGAGGGAGWQHP